MLNAIWPALIILSFIFSLLTGKINELNSSIFTSGADAVATSINFLGTMCLWSGLMKIVQETTLIHKIDCILKPIMKILFPEIKKDNKAYQEITMNISANILGLGNAATPLGLRAMETLQKENPQKDTLSNNMAMFIILNTASVQLIPTTVIAIRASLGSQTPAAIIVPTWFATVIADIIGIIITKIFIKKFK